jgi:hypothetical protein
MNSETSGLLTVTEIARRLDVAPHAVTYVVKTRGIEPVRWAGHARLFDEGAVGRIASELARIATG